MHSEHMYKNLQDISASNHTSRNLTTLDIQKIHNLHHIFSIWPPLSVVHGDPSELGTFDPNLIHHHLKSRPASQLYKGQYMN